MHAIGVVEEGGPRIRHGSQDFPLINSTEELRANDLNVKPGYPMFCNISGNVQVGQTLPLPSYCPYFN